MLKDATMIANRHHTLDGWPCPIRQGQAIPMANDDIGIQKDDGCTDNLLPLTRPEMFRPDLHTCRHGDSGTIRGLPIAILATRVFEGDSLCQPGG